MILQCQEQRARWTCYQDLRSCASQLVAAFVTSWFGLQISAGLSWKCIRRQHNICRFLKVSGSTLTAAEESTRTSVLELNRSRATHNKKCPDLGQVECLCSSLALFSTFCCSLCLWPCFIAAQRSNRTRTVKLDSSIRRNGKTGLYHVLQIRERLRAFTFLTPPGLPAWLSSWPGVP